MQHAEKHKFSWISFSSVSAVGAFFRVDKSIPKSAIIELYKNL